MVNKCSSKRLSRGMSDIRWKEMNSSNAKAFHYLPLYDAARLRVRQNKSEQEQRSGPLYQSKGQSKDNQPQDNQSKPPRGGTNGHASPQQWRMSCCRCWRLGLLPPIPPPPPEIGEDHRLRHRPVVYIRRLAWLSLLAGGPIPHSFWKKVKNTPLLFFPAIEPAPPYLLVLPL